MIPESTIQSIKERADILSVIGSFVDLKRVGKEYRGLSPFNEEKSPSFYVVPSKGIFKDFSSGKGGDVITFIREYLNLSYVQAIEYLANREGLSLDNTKADFQISKTQKRQPVVVPVQLIAWQWLDRSIKARQYPNNFLQFFSNRFGAEKSEEIGKRFKIGYSSWCIGANVFWYVTDKNEITLGKIMLYDVNSGKRDKHKFNTVHSLLSKAGLLPTEYSLKRSLFGLHQITYQSEVRCICIVESEKTACLCSLFIPSVIWMATGGKEFFKAEVLEPVKSFPLVVYPDNDAWEQWKLKAEGFASDGFKINVSDLLKRYASEDSKEDLADFLLSIQYKEEPTEPEYALDGTLIHTEKGYPISWDLKTESPLEKMIRINPMVKALVKTFDLVEIEN